MKFPIHRSETGSIKLGYPKGKFIDVPQEVDEWFSRLDEKDMILMVAQAIEYAAGYLGKTESEVIKEAHELIIIEDLCASGHTV